MDTSVRIVVLFLCLHVADFTASNVSCTIELRCAECVPDNMPIVTSHRAADGGTLSLAEGERVSLSCGGGSFLAYGARGELAASCERGRFRLHHDRALRHLLELGCQESIFEDVQHHVEYCGAPLQGRVYRTRTGGAGGAGGVRHLAAMCYDAERGLATRALMVGAPRNTLPLPPHEDRLAPLSILGNFEHMFDAATRRDAILLYSDGARLNRRLRETFKHERVSFAEHQLGSAPLLAAEYFEAENAAAADFASNRVATWRAVAAGNLAHVRRDVAALMAGPASARLSVHAGTHGVGSLRTEGGRAPLFLKPGRFPVPRYVWTVVHDRREGRAVALVVLNDPFVAVSEIAEAVFCESACGRVSWLQELRRHRNYETPALGLTFCCRLIEFADVVTELPRDAINVTAGDAGLLTDLV